MHIAKPILTQHRRARLIAWTLAMLAWLASVLFEGAPFTQRCARQRGKRMSLEGLARQVKLLIVSRGGELARLRRRKPGSHYRGRSLRRPGRIRALIGA